LSSALHFGDKCENIKDGDECKNCEDIKQEIEFHLDEYGNEVDKKLCKARRHPTSIAVNIEEIIDN